LGSSYEVTNGESQDENISILTNSQGEWPISHSQGTFNSCVHISQGCSTGQTKGLACLVPCLYHRPV